MNIKIIFLPPHNQIWEVAKGKEGQRDLRQGGILVSQDLTRGNFNPFREVKHSVYSDCKIASCGLFEMSGGDV